MLTTEEKRFIRYWQEQRESGKIKYYLLYIITGSLMAMLAVNFLYSLLFSGTFSFDWTDGLINFGCVVAVTIITVSSWDRNEKKFKRIIKREIKEGQKEDEKFNNENLV